MFFIAKLFICQINSAHVKWDSANSEFKSGHSLCFMFYFVFEVVFLFYFQFLIVDFKESLLMLIFSKKSVVDVDRKGKKVLINILVDPPCTPSYETAHSSSWAWGFLNYIKDCIKLIMRLPQGFMRLPHGFVSLYCGFVWLLH